MRDNDAKYARNLANELYVDTETRNRSLERHAFVKGFTISAKNSNIDVYFWAIVCFFIGLAIGGFLCLCRAL